MASNNEPNADSQHDRVTEPADSTRATDRPLVNPYQPPAPPPPGTATDDQTINETYASGSSNSKFWIGVVVAIVTAVALTYITGGGSILFAVTLTGAALRVALVQHRRAIAGKDALAMFPLLITSTLFVLGLLISCTVAFCAVCMGGVAVTGPGGTWEPVLLWMVISGGFALAVFVLLFALSIKWAS